MRAPASEFPNDNRALHRGAVWVTSEPCSPWEPEALMTPEAPSVEPSTAAEPVLECQASSAEEIAAPPAELIVEALTDVTETVIATVECTAPSMEEPAPLVLGSAVVEVPMCATSEQGVDTVFERQTLDEPDACLDEIEIVDELEPIELDLEKSAEDDPFAAFVRTLVEVAVEAGCDKAAAILPALLEEGIVMPGVLPTSVTDALLLNGMLLQTDAGLVGGESFRKTAAGWRAILRGDSEDFSSCGPRMLDEWAADLIACLVAVPGKVEGLRRQLRTRGVAAFGLVLAA